MRKMDWSKFYAVSSRIFTVGLLVAAMSTLATQRDLLLNLRFLGITLFVALLFHVGVQASALAATLFFRRLGSHASFASQLSLQYRFQMANFALPSILGPALQMKRFGARHSPSYAIWFLILQRVLNFFFISGLGLFVTLSWGHASLETNVYQILMWPFGAGLTLSLLVISLIAFAPVSLERMLPQRLAKFLEKTLSLRGSIATEGLPTLAAFALIQTALGAVAAFALGIALWPHNPVEFLLARLAASLMALFPLPLPAMATREIGSVGLLVLLGAPVSIAAVASSISIFAVATGAGVGLFYEASILLRGRSSQRKESQT